MDLSQVVPCISGPKRPQDRIELTSLQANFRNSLASPLSFTVCILSASFDTGSSGRTDAQMFPDNLFSNVFLRVLVSALKVCKKLFLS